MVAIFAGAGGDPSYNPSKKYVLMSGLPGNMATESAELIAKSEEYELLPYALTGPGITQETIRIGDKDIRLITPDKRGDLIRTLEEMDCSPIVLEFAHPSAVNPNAEWYVKNGLPFVMGTTGGDRVALENTVRESDISAVIAPNMAMEIVAYMEFMQDFTKEYEGRWIESPADGIYIRESHQGVDVPNDFKGKADTSGTAKAMVKIFKQIGIPVEEKDINKIRDREDQLKIGVPEEALDGHGYHRYKLSSFGPNQNLLNELYVATLRFLKENPVFDGYKESKEDLSGFQDTGLALRSPDGTVLFRVEKREGEIKIDHNVDGRLVYARGTLRALEYLEQKVSAGNKGDVYSMIDVLKGA